MAAGNSAYTVTTATDYAAVAIEKRLTSEWQEQITTAMPLLACIKEGKHNFRKGYTVEGNKALVPIVYSDVAAVTTSNLGIADADEIGAAWPTWDATQGFTNAVYAFSHFRRAMTFKNSEEMIAQSRVSLSQRGNLKEGKTQQLIYTFLSRMADMIEGEANNASRTKLMGIPYVIATANAPGGIDQSDSDNSWWRGNVQAVGGSISLPAIDTQMDNVRRYANYSGKSKNIDLLMLSYAAGGVNVYGGVRSQIAPVERINDIEFEAKYGIENFIYRAAKCIQGNRMPSGTIYGLSTDTFFWGGDVAPKKVGEPLRILGSDSFEHMYNLWAFLGCNRPNLNFRMTGIS